MGRGSQEEEHVPFVLGSVRVWTPLFFPSYFTASYDFVEFRNKLFPSSWCRVFTPRQPVASASLVCPLG